MTNALLNAAVTGVLAVLILAGMWLLQKRSLVALVKTRYGVTLLNGETFTGILTEHSSKYLVFVDAQELIGSEKRPVDGELYLMRDRINYLQKLGGN